MVTIENRQILIDGKPELILSGEIHYYRLDKKDWQDRITKLKAAGMNTVATYIPWLCHEPQEGAFDLDGHTRPELDIKGFIQLCEDNGLYVIVRPGPFIMAEMKNEGIPHWVAKKYPDVVPVSWDGKKITGYTLDYLNPNFLECTKKWYAQIMPVIAEHLQGKGGKVIGVQLDNEIGMLSWCTNCPDLTDIVLEDMNGFLKEQYSEDELKEKYPFDVNDKEAFADGIRSPKESYVLTLKKDLGHYMRRRYAKYVAVLTEYAKEFGVTDIPYLVNIHGTGGGRGFTYMIGISQLYEAYTQSDEILPGSDIYLGDMTLDKFQDLYLINAYMEAVNRENQPLASFEFECGDANYGEAYAARTDVSAVDIKARMCVAQGNKALNCYLFCGGRNYLMDGLNDGNGRIAITGERHGFAAPIGPEGQYNYTYDRLAQVMKVLSAVSDKLAAMQEERDDIALGFIPDYYMTEYTYPTSEKEKEMQENVVRFRGFDGIERFAKSMLLNNYRFTSLNIQDDAFTKEDAQTIVVFTASYMAPYVQQKLVDFAKEGGSLMLYGMLPVMDMEGNPCTILKDALGIGQTQMYYGDGRYFLAVQPAGYIGGCAEISTMYAQTYEVDHCEVLLYTADKKETTAFEKHLGDGKVIMMGTHYICHLENQKKMLKSLGSEPALSHNAEYHGLFMTVMKNEADERFLHIFNLDGFEKHGQIVYNHETLFDGMDIRFASKDGLMLPLNMEIDGKKVIYSTAEIMQRHRNFWSLRLTQASDKIVFEGTGIVAPSADYEVSEKDGRTIVTSRINGRLVDKLVLKFL